jgi:hypothetical protein
MLVNVPQVQADNIVLTLDLRNTNRASATSGGTWQLFARKQETGTAPNGDNGIAGIRAVINNISIGSVTFASGINAMSDTSCNGGQCVQTLSNGAVEIVYGQDLSAAGVVTGVGVFANVFQDRLIASGSWPAGAGRPTFGTDAQSFGSEANFLLNASAPWGNALEVSGANIITEVYTLGDLNNSNTVTSLDIGGFVARLPGASPSLPYHAAADINQSGTITGLDISPFVAILSGPTAAAVSVVPEPSTFGLALLASLGLFARRRHV